MGAKRLNKIVKNDGHVFLSVNDVAKLLNINPNTVRRWSNGGILRSFQIGLRGPRKFWIEDIKTFLPRK